jgi:hypothetical protein
MCSAAQTSASTATTAMVIAVSPAARLAPCRTSPVDDTMAAAPPDRARPATPTSRKSRPRSDRGGREIDVALHVTDTRSSMRVRGPRGCARLKLNRSPWVTPGGTDTVS